MWVATGSAHLIDWMDTGQRAFFSSCSRSSFLRTSILLRSEKLRCSKISIFRSHVMSSDYGLSKVGDIDAAFPLRTSRFQFTPRPWLDLYGVYIRPVAPFGSASSKPYVDHAMIHRCLPDELLNEVFARMSPYSLGRAACVCRKWRYTIRSPPFWRSACLKAWQVSGVAENYKILQSTYQGSWRKMWLLRPRIRTDGLYVSRNTYIRAGVAEWKVTNPVHLVCYFRYMRFFSSGRFLYKNSSQKLKDVVKFMNFRASKAETVFNGHYTLSDDKDKLNPKFTVEPETIIKNGGLLASNSIKEMFYINQLRGTTAGANNRMDVISLVTSGLNHNEISGHEEDLLGVVGEWQEDETHNADVPAVSHRRGMAPFVFVPFEEVETSILNLPVDKMDYFVPG